MTNTAARDGTPPMEWAISIATGVVTDFGEIEYIISCPKPNHFANNTPLPTPTIAATTTLVKMGIIFFVNISHCLYNG